MYVLTVAKTGSKMTKSLNQDELAGLGLRGLARCGQEREHGELQKLYMQGFVMDRPVLDRTGLEGRYDFQLDWTPDEFPVSTLGVKAPPCRTTRPIRLRARQSNSRWAGSWSRSTALADVMVVVWLENLRE